VLISSESLHSPQCEWGLLGSRGGAVQSPRQGVDSAPQEAKLRAASAKRESTNPRFVSGFSERVPEYDSGLFAAKERDSGAVLSLQFDF